MSRSYLTKREKAHINATETMSVWGFAVAVAATTDWRWYWVTAFTIAVNGLLLAVGYLLPEP